MALVVAAIVLSATGAIARQGPAVATRQQNPTARENARPGTRGWSLSPSPGRAIEGYASALSIVAGRPLSLHVSTAPGDRYRVEVYRLGWYHGLGARLVTCVPSCHGSRVGRSMPVPPANLQAGEIVANWPVTDTIRSSSTWVSGEYVAQLVLAGRHKHRVGRSVPFVLRPARELSEALLAEVPVNTWEAYNNWGGKSLYAYNSSHGTPAVEVSFERPWAYGDPNLTFPVVFEYPMLRFLERSGLPLEYVTDIDVDRQPWLLRAHRLSVTLGHGEYWSERMRSAWDHARAVGRNLAFLGADTGYWQIRYAASHRAIVEYRSAARDPDPAPAEKTTTFRALDPPRPECELLGVEFQGGGLHPPLVKSYEVVARHNPWLTAAGLRPGNRLPGAVRGEWDGLVPGCADPPPTVLLRYAGRYPADATLVRTPSGGRVLALGTEGFGRLVDGWGKSRCRVDIRAERFLRVALLHLAGLAGRALASPGAACPHRRQRQFGPLAVR